MRRDLQQDKLSALLDLVRMFEEHRVPYVITGGIAIQLYITQPRHTQDVDVVSLRKPFEQMKVAQPWGQYGFELVFDHRRHIKLRHASSNVDVDINVDTRFARLLDAPTIEMVEGRSVPFTSPLQIAFAKLRTQRSDWPRDPRKRLQDRADLVGLLQCHPEIATWLKADPGLNDEMRSILQDVVHTLAQPSSDELPPEEETGGTCP